MRRRAVPVKLWYTARMSSALSLTDIVPWMTAEQFAEWPGDGTGRLYQLIDGEPVTMNLGSWAHGALHAWLATLLANHLHARKPSCRAAISVGLQPRAGARRNVRVPELAVSCASVRGHYMQQPITVAEIMSQANAAETREAVRNYLTIPSVQDVLVVSSVVQAAELLCRQPDGTWPEEPVMLGAEDTLVLASLDFTCRLADIYAR
jgi:Uma2 family endonuclease